MLLRKNKASVKKVFVLCICAGLISEGFSQQMVLKSQAIGSGTLVKNSGVSTQKKQNSNSSASVIIKTQQDAAPAIEESTSEVVIVNKTAPTGVDINFIPLFGNFIKTESQQVEDQLFLSDCDNQFKSRSEGSEFFSKMGWDYLSDGDKNTAIHRFNLSWLLNPDNVVAYWGTRSDRISVGEFSKCHKTNEQGFGDF